MKTQFNKKLLTLAILSALLPAANGNAAGAAGVSAKPAAVPGPKAPETQLVSVNLAGTDSGNFISVGPTVLSANGRFVAFYSYATDLVANLKSGLGDILVRDLKTGTTTLASVYGFGAGEPASAPVMSADGRFVAFYRADGAAPFNNFFVHDLKTGTTALGSVNSAGTAGGNGFSYSTALSADGRFVAFRSNASDLVANDTNGRYDAFVRDLKTGTTLLVSVNSAGTASGNGSSSSPVLSADVRFVAFDSGASDLVANDTNGAADVFVRDLKTGTTTLASVNNAGTASGNGSSSSPVLSADGRFVAFLSNASDLVANDTNGAEQDVFVRDLKTGTTTLASVNLAGTGSGDGRSQDPVLSANGRFVAFLSGASDLVANDTNGAEQDVFVRDLKTGTTTLASVNLAGTGSGDGRSQDPVLSANGRFVAFLSGASNLVANDANGTTDTFVRDLKTGTTTLASINLSGTASGNGESPGFYAPALSADGRLVAFSSSASDLVANDTNNGLNGIIDVFVRPTQ